MSSDSDTDLEESQSRHGLEPYLFEPRKNNTDSEDLQDEDSDEENDNSLTIRIDRTGTKSWCMCGVCEIMPTHKESCCCHEMARCDEKRNGNKLLSVI